MITSLGTFHNKIFLSSYRINTLLYLKYNSFVVLRFNGLFTVFNVEVLKGNKSSESLDVIQVIKSHQKVDKVQIFSSLDNNDKAIFINQ